MEPSSWHNRAKREKGGKRIHSGGI
jgi:hypothetical protein